MQDVDISVANQAVVAIKNIVLSYRDNADKLSDSELEEAISQLDDVEKIFANYQHTDILILAINSLKAEKLLRQLDE